MLHLHRRRCIFALHFAFRTHTHSKKLLGFPCCTSYDSEESDVDSARLDNTKRYLPRALNIAQIGTLKN
jgi:hypothetical protein